MMLSKESEEFIANLKMYLMTSGKNEKEIDEISQELRDHLEDAESRGKTVDSVTGGSPETYLKNLSSEMKIDVFGILKVLPMLILLLAAYFITGSAIRGDLSFSLLSIIAYPVITLFGVVSYIYFMRKMSISTWSTKKTMVILMTVQFVISISFLAVLFLDTFILDPLYIYIPSREVMWVIAAAGAATFIAGALWSKSWFTIIIPILLVGPDFAMHFVDVTVTQQLIISSSTLYIGMALVVLFIFLKNRKQTGQ